MTARDVRAAAEPAKLKLVPGIVNKGTRDAPLRAARTPRGPSAPRPGAGRVGAGRRGAGASAGRWAPRPPRPAPVPLPGRGRAEDGEVPLRVRGDKLTSLFCLSFQLQRARAPGESGPCGDTCDARPPR